MGIEKLEVHTPEERAKKEQFKKEIKQISEGKTKSNLTANDVKQLVIKLCELHNIQID